MVNPVYNIPKNGEQSSALWQEWYRELLDYFGRKQANAIFIKAWSLRAPRGFWNSANTKELRDLLSKNGLNIDESAVDELVDVGSGVLDFAGDLFAIGKYSGLALLTILIGGIGLLVYNVVKDPAKTAGTAIKYAK